MEVSISQKSLSLSERVRSMRAHRKHKLEQKLVGGESFAVAIAAKLSTDLAELARPVGEHDGAAGVLEETRRKKDRAVRERRANGIRLRIRRQTGAALRTIE